MPRKESRVRIERGLYRSGKVYLACATPMGSRKVVWKKLGAVGLMEARRLRVEFAAQTRRAPAAPARRRMTYGETVQEWLTDQEARVAAGDLASSTLEGYHDGLKRHILPVFGDRQILSITPDDLVRWHRYMQRRGLPAWSKVGTSPNDRNVANRGLKVACREAGLEGVSFHALRHTFASILIAQGHDVVFVSRQLGHANAAITLTVYAHLFDAARHAETARQRLDEDYRAVLRRREEPGRQLGFDL